MRQSQPADRTFTISVIIPAYNEEKYIAASLTAVLAQDYPDFEVMVVNNASTDKTAEIARAFPVKVLDESRKGTMWACERGRREARGDLIVRMDADCLPDKDWLSKGAALFKNPAVAAATGPYDYFDDASFFRKFALFFQKYIYRATNALLQRLGRGGILTGGNSFMRASGLQKIGGFNTAITFYGDDTDTAIRMARTGKIVFDKNLVLKTSSRRLKAEGSLKISLLYLFYFVRLTARSFGRRKKT